MFGQEMNIVQSFSHGNQDTQFDKCDSSRRTSLKDVIHRFEKVGIMMFAMKGDF